MGIIAAENFISRQTLAYGLQPTISSLQSIVATYAINVLKANPIDPCIAIAIYGLREMRGQLNKSKCKAISPRTFFMR